MNCMNRLIALAGVACLTLCTLAVAQPYPSKPIRLITPAAPSSSDSLARAIATRVGEKLGQAMIVENRAGAGGHIAVTAGARSAPDGYTFLITPNQITIAPWTTRDLGYDPAKDLSPVGRLGVAAFVLAVSPTLRVKDFAEFVALVRSQPGKLDYGSPGIGTPQHLSMEYIKQARDLNMVHIPYPQSGTAVTDMTAGRIAGGIFALTQVVSLAQSGKVQILNVIGDKRSSLLPDVPSIQEAGVNALDNPWVGLFAPAGTPGDIIDRINREVNATLNLPEVRDALFKQGVTVSTSTPAELGAQLRGDLERWRKVVSAAGIQPQ